MLLTMAEIVFDMVALIFKRIESFIFNFPAGTAGFDQLNDILFVYRLIGYPAVVIGCFPFTYKPIFKIIYPGSIFISI